MHKQPLIDYSGFDIEEVRQAARVLSVINSYYVGCDPCDIMREIVEFARTHLPVGCGLTYGGTKGFYVTTFRMGGDGAWSYKVTIAAFTVNSYIDGVMERLHKITNELALKGQS